MTNLMPNAAGEPSIGGGLGDHVYNRLLGERIIFLGQQVDDEIANKITAQMLLLAADPTGHLDRQTGHQVRELLLNVNRARKTTIVLVTHDPELAGMADITIALRDGRVTRVTERQGGEQAAAV